MKFKFNINKEKALLEVLVQIPKRKNGLDKRLRVSTKMVKNLVKEEFKCPNEYTIGDCLIPGTYLDNDFDQCEATWLFLLDEDSKVELKKQANTKKTRSNARKKSVKK